MDRLRSRGKRAAARILPHPRAGRPRSQAGSEEAGPRRPNPAPGGNAMERAAITTAFTIEGYRVTRHLGIVRGITVRSRSVFGQMGASLQQLVGGN
ncbi:MAG TPA: heavy metal-binding domain-containing protein, partial [Armatimonadota bacterium]|nr:heavy metal-binding domain-containing protein [Armatimonadota bacterium]